MTDDHRLGSPKQSGVAIATLEMSVQRMVRRISEASIGKGEAQLRLEAQARNKLHYAIHTKKILRMSAPLCKSSEPAKQPAARPSRV